MKVMLYFVDPDGNKKPRKMTSYASALGRRLYLERKRLGHTQAVMAELCGVTPTSQYFYEKGKRIPAAEYLQRASKAGINVLFVIGVTEVGSDLRAELPKLRETFIRTDRECRSTCGRLLDVAHRADYFEELVLDLSSKQAISNG